MATHPVPTTARRYIGFTRHEWQTMLHFLLHGLGFVASTMLITWGLFCLFFLAIGGFSFDGFVHQLNNFTTRYVAADPARTGRLPQHVRDRAHDPLHRRRRSSRQSHPSAACG